jgi:hypothetical protein
MKGIGELDIAQKDGGSHDSAGRRQRTDSTRAIPSWRASLRDFAKASCLFQMLPPAN